MPSLDRRCNILKYISNSHNTVIEYDCANPLITNLNRNNYSKPYIMTVVVDWQSREI